MKRLFCLLLLAMGLAPVLLAQDAAVLYVPEKVTFAESLRVRGKVKDECRLETRVADDIAHQARSVYERVVREKPKRGPYHVLEVEIVEAFGLGGGVWSGPKRVELRGVLRNRKGKKLGSFTANRHSMGGVFGAFKGTCKILHRCSKALGKDIASFLSAPVDGIHLGD